jgi:hypothetical protein
MGDRARSLPPLLPHFNFSTRVILSQTAEPASHSPEKKAELAYSFQFLFGL